jgi:LytS/YehU family sensor histidine kinase
MRADRFQWNHAPAVLLAWLVVGIFRFAHHWTYNFPIQTPLAPLALYYVFDAVRWSLFTFGVLLFVRRYPAASLSRLELWTKVAPLLVGGVAINLMLDIAVFAVIAPSPFADAWPGIITDFLQKRFHRMLLDATMVVLIAYGISIQQTLAGEEVRRAELEAAVTESRMTVLRQQLHPHLLFNTMNSISALIRSNPIAAETMLARVSHLFRGILRVGSRNAIPLREDLAFAETFLSIQEYRFPEGLRTEIAVGAGVLDAAVPALLLQPLVENSIKHSLMATSGSAFVGISAAASGHELVLQVRDPGPRPDGAAVPEGFGVGLVQTRERLAKMYGAAASIRLTTAAGGTTVTVRLPLQFLGNEL